MTPTEYFTKLFRIGYKHFHQALYLELKARNFNDAELQNIIDFHAPNIIRGNAVAGNESIPSHSIIHMWNGLLADHSHLMKLLTTKTLKPIKEEPKMSQSKPTAPSTNMFNFDFNMQDFTQKMMNSFFRNVDAYVDVMQGKTGIKTTDGFATLNLDTENVLDSQIESSILDMSVALPAWALRTPAKDIKPGDIVVYENNKLAFVLKINEKSIEVLKPSGQQSRYNMNKISFNGTQGFFIVKSLFGDMFSPDRLDSDNPMTMMIPMMFAAAQSGQSPGMEQMMPMMMMMGQKSNQNPMQMMMMMQMMNGANQSNETSNPMQMMMQMMMMQMMMK